MDVVIQHWIVAVARAAGLEGADELDIPSSTEPTAAWDVACMKTGTDPEEMAECVADHYGLDVADLDEVDPHAYRLLPARVARKLHVVPVGYSDRHLWVATADPVSLEAEREIGHVAGRNVHFEVAAPSFLIPAVEATYPAEEPAHVVPPLDTEGRGGPRILVVDDDPDTRLLLRSALEDDGFRVTEAGNGKVALEELRKAGDDPFTLVTLDLAMPEMSGLEVLTTLRSRLSGQTLPVIVATGMDDPDVEVELFEAGADDFVVKPVDPPRFMLRVRAVLRRHQFSFPGSPT